MSNAVQLLLSMSLQVAVVAALIWSLTRLLRNAPAALRHSLWVLVLVKFFIPPFALWPNELAFWQRPAAPRSEIVQTAQSGQPITIPHVNEPVLPEAASAAPASDTRPVTRLRLPEPAGLVLPLWLAGACVMWLVFMVRMRRQRRLTTGSAPDARIISLMEQCAAKLGMRRLPGVAISKTAPVPMVAGVFRPTVVLPEEVAASCSESDLTAMLLHELAHVKRRDILTAWLRQVAQILFFYHPAVWIAGREVAKEREIACDELVLLSSAIQSEDYARGYVSALRFSSGSMRHPVAAMMAEPFDVERRRLSMMLRRSIPKPTLGWAFVAAIVALLIVPTFEAVEGSGHYSLPAIYKGAVQNISAIHSGSGRIVVRNRSSLAHRASGPIMESQTTYDLIFKGSNYRASVDTEVLRRDPVPGEKMIPVKAGYRTRVHICVRDGRVTVYTPERRSAVIQSATDLIWGADHRLRQLAGNSGRSYTPSLGLVDFGFYVAHTSSPKPIEARVIGHETLDGSKCLVVQLTQNVKGGGRVILRYWVDPDRGFTVLQARKYGRRPGASKDVLADEEHVRLRDYKGVWYPAHVTVSSYGHDSTGRRYVILSTTITYDPGFQINKRVTEADLSLDLPAGTHMRESKTSRRTSADGAGAATPSNAPRAAVEGSVPSTVIDAASIADALNYQEAACGRSLEVTYLSGYLKNQALVPCLTVHYVRTPDALFEEFTRSSPRTSIRQSVDRKTDRFTYLETYAGGATGMINKNVGYFSGTQEIDPILYFLAPRMLKEAVRAGRVAPNMEQVDGQMCWRVEMRRPKPNVEKYAVWVDPSIGFCPRRVDMVWKSGSPYISTAFRDYKSIGRGVWFPMKQVIRDFTATRVPKEHITINTVTAVSIGRDFSKKDLLVKFPSGTQVTDYARNTKYVEP